MQATEEALELIDKKHIEDVVPGVFDKEKIDFKSENYDLVKN